MAAGPRAEAPAPAPAGLVGLAPRTRQLLSDYVELTKPKVQSLLLLTTIATMYVAGDPSPLLVALTCLGGYLSAGGAGAVNHFLDRDLDARMTRTAARPIPAGRIAPHAALAFGCVLAALSLLELSLAVKPLAAALSFAGFLGYVFVYTLWLKRRTPQNIVIGGAAGAFPPMIGWAAVTGDVSLAPIALFLLIFMWTPPHFWALALFRAGDYAKAGVPMLPVVAGARATKIQMLIYTVILLPVALAPWALGVAGHVYGIAAAVLGGLFVLAAVSVMLDRTDRSAKRMFAFSILYLFLLFALIIVDRAPGLMGGLPAGGLLGGSLS